MADEQTDQVDVQDEQQTDGAPATGEPEAPELGDAGKKALDEERAARKAAEKQFKAAQARLKEIEDAGKSEQEKLTEELEVYRTKFAELERSELRNRVAAKHNLGEFVGLLTATSEEELEGQAKLIAKLRVPAEESIPSFDNGPRTKARKAENMNDVIRSLGGR